MGVIINGGMNIGNGRTLISSPYIAPPITFNYELIYPQQPDGVVSSISGATFTPSFTSQSGPFTYTATGIATNPITLGVYIGIGVPYETRADLYKNLILQESIYVNSTTTDIIYQPISILPNDNILIDIVLVD